MFRKNLVSLLLVLVMSSLMLVACSGSGVTPAPSQPETNQVAPTTTLESDPVNSSALADLEGDI